MFYTLPLPPLSLSFFLSIRERSVDVFNLDFQKAFAKVSQKKLMIKVRALGIQERIADCIENWLSNRKQIVTFDE